MKTLAVLAILSVIAAPSGSTRSSATAKAGKTAVTATTERGTTRVSMRSGRRTSAITVHSPARCDSERLSSVIAREVAANAAILGGRPMNGASVRLGSSWEQARRFERGLGEILATGTFRKGTIVIPGSSMNIGKVPPPGKTTRPGRGASVTGLPGGGFRVILDLTRDGGVSDTITVTMNPDAHSIVERVLGFGHGDDRVELKRRDEFDDAGGRTGGSTHAQTQEGPAWGGTIGGGGGGGSLSGGDAGGQGSNPPTMSADGTFSAPDLRVDAELVAAIVNWNRLGAAVTTPNPMDDGHGRPDGSGTGLGSCAHLEDPAFDPSPAYLRPGRRGWVADPRPGLRDP